MLNVNTRILTLQELTKSGNPYILMEMITELNEAKVMLERSRASFIKDGSILCEYLETLIAVDQQLGFLAINLEVLTEALGVLEKRLFIGEICMN